VTACRSPSLAAPGPSGAAVLCQLDRGHAGRHVHTEDGRRFEWGGRSGTKIARADRKRRCLELTLSAEAIAKLVLLAEGSSRSAVVERLVMRARAPR
jgi:hypothetical protein